MTFEVSLILKKKKKEKVILFNSLMKTLLNINYRYNLIPIDIIHILRIKLILRNVAHLIKLLPIGNFPSEIL